MDRLSLFLEPLGPHTPVDPAERLAQALDARMPLDAAWTVYLLGGGRPLRPGLPATLLREAAQRAAGLSPWLFDRCRQAVGDLAETVALTLADEPVDAPAPSLSDWIAQVLLPLRGDVTRPAQSGADTALADRLVQAWRALHGSAREVAIRLSFGRWPAVLPAAVLQAAVARHAGLPPAVVAQRWQAWSARRAGPDAAVWAALTEAPRADESDTPAAPPDWPVLTVDAAARPEALGPVDDWIAWPDTGGLPVRLVRRVSTQRPAQGSRAGHPGGVVTQLWGPGGRLLDAAFPDLIEAATALPAPLVLDGVLLAREPGGSLQPRLGKTAPSAAVCRRSPVRLLVHGRVGMGTAGHGTALDVWLAGHPSPFWTPARRLTLRDWGEAQGVLLMRRSDIGTGLGMDAQRWRLPATPMRAQVLLLHAQAGSGRDAGLYSDCTLAVWNRPPRDAAEAEAVIEAIARQDPPNAAADGLLLLPLARCAVGLSAEDRRRVDRLVRTSTVARHGPVRSVRPGLVMSLAFEAIEASARRRSGVMVREPRLLGLCDERAPSQASSLVELLAQADQRRTRFGCQ